MKKLILCTLFVGLMMPHVVWGWSEFGCDDCIAGANVSGTDCRIFDEQDGSRTLHCFFKCEDGAYHDGASEYEETMPNFNYVEKSKTITGSCEKPSTATTPSKSKSQKCDTCTDWYKAGGAGDCAQVALRNNKCVVTRCHDGMDDVGLNPNANGKKAYLWVKNGVVQNSCYYEQKCKSDEEFNFWFENGVGYTDGKCKKKEVVETPDEKPVEEPDASKPGETPVKESDASEPGDGVNPGDDGIEVSFGGLYDIWFKFGCGRNKSDATQTGQTDANGKYVLRDLTCLSDDAAYVVFVFVGYKPLVVLVSELKKGGVRFLNPSDNKDIIAEAIQNLDDIFGNLKVNKWRNEDGSFNTARLASDMTAGVVLGTAGALITSHLVKKRQVADGFEDLQCVIGGQTVAGFGDEFNVGMK